MKNQYYVVTSDADDLEGWTAQTLADALRNEFGDELPVILREGQYGGGGLHECDDDALTANIERRIERVITN